MAKKTTKTTIAETPDPGWRDEYKYFGAKATQRIIGIKGVVTGVEWRLQCAPAVQIQPLPVITKDGNAVSAYLADIHTCDFTNFPKVKTQVEAFDVWLGDQVEDIVSGFTGIVTAIGACLNGCADACVVAQTKDNAKPISMTLNVKRWKILQKAAVAIDIAVQRPQVEQAPPFGPLNSKPMQRDN